MEKNKPQPKKNCRLILPGREYSFSLSFFRNILLFLLLFVVLSSSGLVYWSLQTYKFRDEVNDYLAYRQQRQTSKLPVLWPTESGTVSSGYGPRRIMGSEHLEQHSGVDIAAPFGQRVYASGAGRVIFSGWKGGYGRYVLLDHENDYQSGYGHMSELAVEVGDLVEQGDIIGYVGSSGYSTGPHIHFEIYYKGKDINPLSVLRKNKE